MTENVILRLTFEFSLLILEYTELLESNGKRVISGQLLRSGTSIGANVHEAQNPESRKDFIHKMKIAAKEAEETKYWLMLCNETKNYPGCEELLLRIIVINKILGKIISSSK